MVMNNLPTCDIFGVPINAMTMNEVLTEIDQRIADRRQTLIGVVNAAKMVNMRRNPNLGEAVHSADMILADGMGVVWAAKLLRRNLPERVTGIDLMERLLEQGNRKHYRIYCLGASEAVLNRTVNIMREAYPGLTVAGCHHGYFNEQQEAQIAEDIRTSRSDIIFVAMTSPKKEEFLARWNNSLDVPICHGVGGSFDVMAGKVKRAPKIFQKLGLEWLYRVIQEPRRMWRRYLVTNTLFAYMLLCEVTDKILPRRAVQG